MTMPAPTQRFTPQEYLRLEQAADGVRHEFHAGEVLAMSDGTYRHSRINANTIRAVGNRLEGSPCFVLESNMRVRLEREDRYVYPDASIVCGEPRFDPLDKSETTITNPRVLIEVLSESTEAYDRGAKFTAYRDLESFEEYVLISQKDARVETFTRQSDGTWIFAAYEGLHAVALLRAQRIELPLAEVYAGLAATLNSESPKSE